MAEPPLAPAAALGNASTWYNFTSWTANQFGYARNMTKIAPSLEDLVLAGPRMVRKLGSFIYLPDTIDGFGQRVIPDPTTGGSDMFGATTSALTSQFGTEAATAAAAAATAAAGAAGAAATEALASDDDAGPTISRFSMDGTKGLGSVFSYATSKWALCCIAMAIILNRTYIFGATRRRLRLQWPLRLALRIVPIILFVIQARRLLWSIQCQTSPDFSELRWGDAAKKSDLLFSQANPFLHGLSSKLLFGLPDGKACLAANMVPSEEMDPTHDLRGSLSLLWPLFGSFCLSQFLETICWAVQRRPVAAETGMTLFEHSLAFAEADAAISSQLGWGIFAGQKAGANATSQESASTGASIAISRAMVMRRVNTPPEVLLVAFLSAMSHITSHILGIFDLQSRFRLVNTGFWGMCFMASIAWSAMTFSLEEPSGLALLRFPTVCIIGFIPHVLVLLGILVCLSIYGFALLLTTLAPPDGQGTQGHANFKERLRRAHANMQANISLADVRITMEMDFYTALLRTGFAAVTMASEAVYLNEDRKVKLKPFTWLEDERYREVEQLRMQWMGTGYPGSQYDPTGTIGLVPVKDDQVGATGYSRERAAQKLSKTRAGKRRISDGVGAAERSGRWLMALEYLMYINRLIIMAWALAVSKALSMIGIQQQPQWLLWLARRPKSAKKEEGRRRRLSWGEHYTEWMDADGVEVGIPRSDTVDVEMELRAKLLKEHGGVGDVEREIDSKLYGWWRKGGWWGSADTSGDYRPETSEDDDLDTTSVISFSTDASEAEWVSDDEDSRAGGQRTPTQRSPFPSRESSPMTDLPMHMTDDLARLLHPATPQDREEAKTLAAHLRSDRIVTRSHYRQLDQRQRAQILVSRVSRRPGGGGSGDDDSADGELLLRRAGIAGKLSPDEEAQLLEQILLTRRRGGELNPGEGPSASDASSWETGAAGLGPDGPQCVVCQCAPRTIIVWPCRCLSLCDDCRVSLAMNNFDKCVCCRREVISYSRIWVP